MGKCVQIGNNNCATNNISNCKPWSITDNKSDACLASTINEEITNLSGAPIVIHRLLGVHEQEMLINKAIKGRAISGGYTQNNTPTKAFTRRDEYWQSKQAGPSMVDSAFIGYDFGPKRLANGRIQYSVADAHNRVEIKTITIKQSNDPAYRVKSVRVERSENGRMWYGVDIIDLVQDGNLNTYHIKSSAPSRYWRLRPSALNDQCNGWRVYAIELFEQEQTNIGNIQDKIFAENRNRDYGDPITIKGTYELISLSSSLTNLGLSAALSDYYTLKINFNMCVQTLGRPVVIGDIIELPTEVQYSAEMKPIKRYLEVQDVSWDTSSYAPNWTPTTLLIRADFAIASEETQDIFGDMVPQIDNMGTVTGEDGRKQNVADWTDELHTIYALSKDGVPERGIDEKNVFRTLEEEEIEAATVDGFPAITNMQIRSGHLTENGLPPNGESFTEGPEFPESPKDRAYHRLTYEGTVSHLPARLYRFSAKKSEWIYIETDRRAAFNNPKNILAEFRQNKDSTSAMVFTRNEDLDE